MYLLITNFVEYGVSKYQHVKLQGMYSKHEKKPEIIFISKLYSNFFKNSLKCNKTKDSYVFL